MKTIVKEGNYLVQGVTCSIDGLIFTFEAPKDTKCEILFYKKGTYDIDSKVVVPKEYSIGNLYSVEIIGLKETDYEYNYSFDGKIVTDPFSVKVTGREKWADFHRKEYEFQVKSETKVQFESSKAHKMKRSILKENLIIYKLNVRSFTMDTNDSNRGTFQALKDKIPYLKKLGVNCLELMPIYEFEELIITKKDAVLDYAQWKKEWDLKEQSASQTKTAIRPIMPLRSKVECETTKVNCWGYANAFYFAPKASYAYECDAAKEFRALIMELHKNDMECILEMYFYPNMNESLMINILKFWTREYGVDGFHLLGQNLPIKRIADEALLSSSKIFCDSYFEEMQEHKENLFVYNEEFLYAARKMLSFKEASLFDFMQQMKKQSSTLGFVNFIADNNGYTLADLFTYEEKHNEANQEDNLDGNDWNYSTNCGLEGETRKRTVLSQRKKQMKNAIALLFLAQGIPLLFSGDEFLNSQKGNNNAYCQDNQTGWINWKQFQKKHMFFEFVQQMIQFRKEHPIISLSQPMKMTDYSAKGYPDLSYHGEEAWQAGESIQRYTIGMLYCGDYSLDMKNKREMIYIAYNFHPQKKSLAIPVMDKKRKWFLIMNTALEEGFLEKEEEIADKSIELQGQSICILIGK